MRTNLGNLPITIDPVTGQAKVVRGSSISRHSQTAAEASAGRANPGRGEVAGSIPALAPTFDSQLEHARSQYLWGLQLAGNVRGYAYHPFTVHLAKGLTYTPDFLVWWDDGLSTIEEVKGSLKQKNARDSLTRLKMAADKLPMFRWMLITRVRQEWRTRRI